MNSIFSEAERMLDLIERFKKIYLQHNHVFVVFLLAHYSTDKHYKALSGLIIDFNLHITINHLLYKDNKSRGILIQI